MPHDKVVAIFGSDLFENIELLPIALELLGKKEKKPLECVGTHEENIAAFYLSTQKRQATGQPLPPLLAQIHDQVLQTEPNLKERAATVLSSWNDQHSIPGQLEETIRNLVVPSP
jgi:hypothetical protein